MGKLTSNYRRKIIELVRECCKIKDITSNFNVHPSHIRWVKEEHLKKVIKLLLRKNQDLKIKWFAATWTKNYQIKKTMIWKLRIFY